MIAVRMDRGDRHGSRLKRGGKLRALLTVDAISSIYPHGVSRGDFSPSVSLGVAARNADAVGISKAGRCVRPLRSDAV